MCITKTQGRSKLSCHQKQGNTDAAGWLANIIFSYSSAVYKQAGTSPDKLYSITDGEIQLKQDADHNTTPALQAETSFSSFCNYK